MDQLNIQRRACFLTELYLHAGHQTETPIFGLSSRGRTGRALPPMPSQVAERDKRTSSSPILSRKPNETALHL